jgi:hypothetical protein
VRERNSISAAMTTSDKTTISISTPVIYAEPIRITKLERGEGKDWISADQIISAPASKMMAIARVDRSGAI